MKVASSGICVSGCTASVAIKLTPLADESLAILVTALAVRLNRGASEFYQRHFNIGMAEFRLMLALYGHRDLNVGEIAVTADVEKAAASRCLRMLAGRGLVDVEQTQSRGRAAIVNLTATGRTLAVDLRKSASRRERRLATALLPGELEATQQALRKLVGHVPLMNKDE